MCCGATDHDFVGLFQSIHEGPNRPISGSDLENGQESSFVLHIWQAACVHQIVHREHLPRGECPFVYNKSEEELISVHV